MEQVDGDITSKVRCNVSIFLKIYFKYYKIYKNSKKYIDNLKMKEYTSKHIKELGIKNE